MEPLLVSWTRFLQVWWESITDVSLQFAVLAGLVALALCVGRRLDPRLRHLAWVIVLVRLLVPVGWETPVGQLPGSTGSGWAQSTPPGPAAEMLRPENAQRSMATGTEPVLSANAPGGAFGGNSRVAAFYLWLAGALVLAILHFARGILARRRLAAAMPPPLWIDDEVHTLAAALGLPSGPPVLLVRREAGLASPCLYGLVKPRLLLPEQMAAWSQKTLQPILIHELVHLRRRDHWVRGLQVLCQTVYFFHPVMWVVSWQIRVERERACDDDVLRYYAGKARPYVESLLRFARAGLVGTAPLGIAAHRSTLARRIRRMLSGRVARPAAAWLAALTVLGTLALAAIGSTEPPGEPEAADREGPGEVVPGRVRGIATIPVAYEAMEDGARGQELPVGGDIELGQRLARGALDPEVLDAETQGKILVRALIRPDGKVVSAAVEEGIEAEIDRTFETFVLGYRFAPSVHKTRGPVFLEVLFHFSIRPEGAPDPDERPVPGRSQVVGEAGGLPARFLAAVDPEGVRLDPWTDQPTDLRGGGDPRPPVLPGDWDYDELNVHVAIDSDGRVIESALLPSRDSWEREEAINEAMAEYLRSFTFPLVVHPTHGPVSYSVRVDMRVVAGQVAALAPLAVDGELLARFEETYRLEPGISMKLIPPPFDPGRDEFHRSVNPMQRRRPARMTLRWDDSGLDRRAVSRCFGGCDSLQSVLRALGIEPFSIVADPRILDIEVSGDLILRRGARRAELLEGLEADLEQELGIALSFDSDTEMRETIVLRGQVGEVAPDPDYRGLRFLHIYNDEKNADPSVGAGGGPGPGTELLTLFLSHALGMPVVDETIGEPPAPFGVRVHDSAQDSEFVENVLRNLEAQTELEIVIEPRPLEVVAVARKE